MIFKTYETDVDELTSQIGFSRRSFAEWGTQVSQSFNDAGKGINGIKEAFKTAFHTPEKVNNIELIQSSDFKKLFDFNDTEFFDYFNEDGSQSLSSLTQWCSQFKEMDETMHSYLVDCMQKQVPASFNDYNKYVKSAIKNNEEFSLSTKLGSMGLQALATAGNMLLMYGISKGIELVATGIDNLVHSAEHCKERVDELMSSYGSAIGNANSNAKTVEGFAARYEELSKGVNSFGRNLSLTADEYAEYNNIVNQIADMFPDMVQGYTAEGNAILSLKGNVEQLRDAYKEAQQEAYNMLITSGEDGDGNDIVENWKNLHETSLAAKFFDFGRDDVGGQISAKEAIEQLEAFTSMSPERYREVTEYVMYGGKTENFVPLTDIENEIGHGSYLYKALEIDETSTDAEIEAAKRRARALVLTYQAEIDAALNDMHLLANAYLVTSDDYEKMDEQSRNMASMIVNSFGAGIASGFEDNVDVASYVTGILAMINEDPEIGNALNGLLTTDFSSLSREDAKALIKQYVDTIKNSADGGLIDLNELLGFTGLEEGDTITLDDMVNKLQKIQNAAVIPETSYKSALEGIQALSGKLGTLQDVFDNIQSDGEFDWSSILNNEEFENMFKDAGSVYDDFIRTVTQNPDDIDACQDAFDRLATAVLDNSGVFDDLTEETKDATIAMLEQNGVMNAAAIVEQRLAANNEYLAMTKDIVALAGRGLSEVTYQEIAAILDEGVASTETASYLAQLAFAKMDVNNIRLDTTDDINQIVAIANAAGTSASYIAALANTLATFKSMPAEITMPEDPRGAIGGAAMVGFRNATVTGLENALKSSLEQQVQNTRLDPAQFYGKRTGGSGGRVPGSSGGSGGGSGGSGGGASEAAKETVETFDWVENKLESLERHVKKLDQTVGRTYKGWSERNSALNQEILEVGGQVWGQVLAYQEYMKKADAVGLSEHYKNLVKDGAIAIEDISDEGLKQQISDFQKWYEKARKCEEEAEELNDTLADLGKTIFEHATQMFEDQLSVMEYSLDMIDAYIDQAEARGHLAGTAYYDSLIKMEQGHISLLKEEYDALTDALAQAMKAGNIEKYSEEWYDMYNSVLDVDKAITEATTSLYEHQNALRELKWDYFDKQQEYTSKLTEEADWLIGLLEKQGSFVEDGDSAFAGSRRRTRRGTAAEGLHALNYNVYMAQADDYAKEILKINEMLAKDPYNLELIEKRNEFLEAQRDNIDAAYDEIEAVKDLMSEGYDAYLEKLQELIDKRKDALSTERDLYDYQKSIAEKTGNIASLEKQLNAYAGDDSEEAVSKVQQLKLELDEAKTDLEETEYEKWVSDQERLMDDLYTEYEQLFNQRLDDIEFVLESMKDTANANAGSIMATLEQATAAVGTALSDEMKNIWKNDGGAGSIVSTYGSGMTAGLTSIQQTLDGIRNFVSAMAGDARQEAADNVAALETRQEAAANKAPTPPAQEAPKQELQTLEPAGSRTDTSFFVHRKDEYPKNKLNVETSIVDRLKYHDYDSSFSQMARYYAAMGFSGTYTGSASQNINMLNWMKSHGLSEGGEIQGLLRQSGETGFALVRTGETVITSEATQNLKAMLKMKDRLGMRKTGKYVFPDAQRMRQQTDEQMKWFQTAPQNTQNNNENVTIQIDNLSLPNVKNYDEFKTALLSDPHFEKVMGQAMADQMLGGNPFNKFRYI